MIWYSHHFQNFPQFVVIHTIKSFGIVNEAEVDVFLKLSCFFNDLVDVGNLISGSSGFPKTSLNIRKFSVHVFLKPGLENFEDYFTRVWDECNRAVVWAFFAIAFLWDWNENWCFHPHHLPETASACPSPLPHLQNTGSQDRCTHLFTLSGLRCVHVLSCLRCVWLCNPMDCSPPGSSVRGILQARILEQVAMPSSRRSFQPRNQTCVSYVSWIKVGKPIF